MDTHIPKLDSIMDNYSHLFKSYDAVELYDGGTDFAVRTLMEDGATTHEIRDILFSLFGFTDDAPIKAAERRSLNAIAKEAEEAETIEIARNGLSAKVQGVI